MTPNVLHFRCIKITLEEKQTSRFEAEPITEQSVSVQFECVEANQRRDNLGSVTTLFHGYLGLTMPAEEFEKAGYAIGQVYSLSPT